MVAPPEWRPAPGFPAVSRLPFPDDVQDFAQWTPYRVGVPPPGQRFGYRVKEM